MLGIVTAALTTILFAGLVRIYVLSKKALILVEYRTMKAGKQDVAKLSKLILKYCKRSNATLDVHILDSEHSRIAPSGIVSNLDVIVGDYCGFRIRSTIDIAYKQSSSGREFTTEFLDWMVSSKGTSVVLMVHTRNTDPYIMVHNNVTYVECTYDFAVRLFSDKNLDMNTIWKHVIHTDFYQPLISKIKQDGKVYLCVRSYDVYVVLDEKTLIPAPKGISEKVTTKLNILNKFS